MKHYIGLIYGVGLPEPQVKCGADYNKLKQELVAMYPYYLNRNENDIQIAILRDTFNTNHITQGELINPNEPTADWGDLRHAS